MKKKAVGTEREEDNECIRVLRKNKMRTEELEGKVNRVRWGLVGRHQKGFVVWGTALGRSG